MLDWRNTHQVARLEEIVGEGVVRCHLSPRNCTLKEGQHGFCGVRANRGGRLVTLNYGKSVHATEETIETEACNHFWPGEAILSMGNVGCMLNCAYCHNWKTSQAKFVSDADVFEYTPEQVVDLALRHGIRCLSWTYNDPVVWHEFVLDTAKLAQQAGLINLYKSAFYITPRAIDELLPYMDIFSISLKSMDPEYYRKLTKGTLEPVLEGIKQVYRAGKHLEVSNLMITDISDDESSARRIAEWHLRELDATVPLHYVRFHPDYRMRDTVRTPIPRLIRAREIALGMGVQHVYLGNVYDTEFSNTYCRSCQQLLIGRYGLNARVVGLDQKGHCSRCGTDAHVKLPATRRAVAALPTIEDDSASEQRSFDWHGDVRSLHAQLLNNSDMPVKIYHRRRVDTGASTTWRTMTLRPKESYRLILAKSSPDDIGPELRFPHAVQCRLHEVFDRAHFPTVDIESVGVQKNDISPLPLFRA